MARTGYHWNAVPSEPDNIDDLRVFLLNNLQTWVVSQTFNFGSGTSERNYLVLSQGPREILLYMPKGGSSNNTLLYNGVVSGYYKTTSQVSPSTGSNVARSPFALGYSPTGGYLAGFSNGLDPANHAAFWQGTTSCLMANTLLWSYGENRELDLYFIEDLARPELTVYCGHPDSGFGIWTYSSQMSTYAYVPEPDPAWGFTTEGVWRSDVTLGSNPPRPLTYPLYTRWRDHNGITENFESSITTGQLEVFGDATQPHPDTGLYEASLLLPGGTPINGHINPDLMREFPGGVTKTGGRIIRGHEPDDFFIHLIQGIITPWAPGLSSPYDQ